MKLLFDLRNRWRWMFFLSRIYVYRGQRKKTRFSSIISWLGIAVGVATLVAVLAVMNGFQGLTIDPLVEVSSFHIRVYGDAEPKKIKELIPDSSAFYVSETRLLVGDKDSGDVLFSEIRGVPPDIMELDRGFASQVVVTDGAFKLDGNYVVLGRELAFSMGLIPGDTISFMTMVPNSIGIISPVSVSFKVAGLFRTGNYAIDSSFVFMSYKNAKNISDTGENFTAVKLRHPASAGYYSAVLKRAGYDAHPFSDYNRALFAALRMEKIFLILLVGFIFLVIGLNLVHGFRRSIFERRGELALLLAVGASDDDVRKVFLIEGLMIGIMGALVGVLWGYLISININAVFSGFEIFVNMLIDFINRIISVWGMPEILSRISIFSSSTFYLFGIPYKIYPSEIFFIVLYASAVSGYAAYSASGLIKRMTIAEVLRNE